MNNKIRVQLIGSYIDGLESPLKNLQVIVENIISGCSPLAMVGDTDSKYIDKFSENVDIILPDILNLKKNLANMLSRSTDDFSQNLNRQPSGKEVRLKNTSDYLIFMNTSSPISLFKKGTVLLSAMRSKDLIEAIKNDKEYYRMDFPFDADFNWKPRYDKFIKTILNEYDNKHIILIRTNSAQWFMENSDIKAFNSTSSLFRNIINEMDEYFIDRTNCLVINEHFNHIPPQNKNCIFPYAIMSEKAVNDIALLIKMAITSASKTEFVSPIPQNVKGFAKLLWSKLSTDIIENNKEAIDITSNNCLIQEELGVKGSCYEGAFFEDLTKLNLFLSLEKEYTLSDYAIEFLGTKKTSLLSDEIEMLELYTKYFKLNINDIIALYMISKHLDNQTVLKVAVDNVLTNRDCYPVCKANRLKRDNLNYLKDYPYLKSSDFNDSIEDVYVHIENNCYLVLNSNSEMPIRKFVFNKSDQFDYKKAISDGYVCSIENADALTYSYDYYIEKARNGHGNRPTYLRFDTERAFLDSLNYFDYSSLLNNERFVFEISNNTMAIADDYTPIVDLTELFDPDLVTVKVTSGLGDQIGYYILGQLIERNSNRKVIYDDTYCIDFNGFEVNRFAKKQMNLVSTFLSSRLLHKAEVNSRIFFKEFYRKINNRYVYFTGNLDYRYKYFGGGGDCFFTSDVKMAVTTVLPYSYYTFWTSVDKAILSFGFSLKDYIEFPPFEKSEHILLSQKMLSCDSVVIHIRRGDYIALGWGIKNEYYVNMISKIMKLPQYPDKKFFVFSDDIKWCRENQSELGLDRVGNCEVFFVDENKYEESFRDIQLMALGKIMIVGKSYFSRIAAIYSDTWEMFFSSDKGICELFKKCIRKNKYNIDEIPSEQKALSASGAVALDNAQPPPKCEIKPLINREYVEWLNFWFDNANEQRDDRILLIGDSVSREYRAPLARLIRKPVDFFATSANLSDEKFFEMLELFFSYKEYRQRKAHIQIGVHGIDGVAKAVQNNSLEEYEKGFERLVTMVMKYIPDVTIALTTPVVQQENLSALDTKINDEIIKRNAISKKIAEKHKLPVNDLYSFMINETHRDGIHFLKEGSEKIARKVAESMKLL